MAFSSFDFATISSHNARDSAKRTVQAYPPCQDEEMIAGRPFFGAGIKRNVLGMLDEHSITALQRQHEWLEWHRVAESLHRSSHCCRAIHGHSSLVESRFGSET